MTSATTAPDDGTLAHIRELCRLPRETEWLEFKVDNAAPERTGEYVSALANAAALHGRACGYLVWGVDDSAHDLVGTSFDPHATKVGNEALENWLHALTDPQVSLVFRGVDAPAAENGRRMRLVMMEVGAATHRPVRFRGEEFIRVGSYKKKLKDHPEKERELWRVFDRSSFAEGIALRELDQAETLSRLAYPAYFELLRLPVPESGLLVLAALEADGLVQRAGAGMWHVNNLGALLFAKDLSRVPVLGRKTLRIIKYKGQSRIQTEKEQEVRGGYASSFEAAIGMAHAMLPANEVIGLALRRNVPLVPELALREVIANALIHQDFSVRGAGPMVEIFDDRVEVTNPGTPLVDVARLLDSPPRSRNEPLAAMMRRLNICEERGTGVDKVVSEIELYQLPPPLFTAPPGSTRVVLFGPRELRQMDGSDRVRACYQHACLRYVNHEFLTNESLRTRFGVDPKNRATVSRLIRDAIAARVITAADPDAAPRLMKYLPHWARAESDFG
ncbi:MAG: ATP-binding protein [Polyangiales bacterium]